MRGDRVRTQPACRFHTTTTALDFHINAPHSFSYCPCEDTAPNLTIQQLPDGEILGSRNLRSHRRASAVKYDMVILMNTMERITITLTPEIAQAVRGAVEAGEYASSSEIIREALRDWRHKRALQAQELADLRVAIQEGLDDIEAGRVRDFDAERIIRRGEERLQSRAANSD